MADYKCSNCGKIIKIRKKRGVPLKKWKNALCGYIGTRAYLKGKKNAKKRTI